MATKVVKRTNKKSTDDFDGWLLREMVLDESEYAVLYVSREDLTGETRVRNKRTDRSEVFANEEYATQAFHTVNAAERERAQRLNREDQALKEQKGYGDW